LEQRDARRRELSARMSDLTRQRDAFAADAERARPRTEDAFDVSVRETLRAQVRQ
jgi:hypothetical protein